MESKKKIIFLTYIPSPYRVHFFNELNKFCDLFVIYYNPKMPNSGWNEQEEMRHDYKHTFLFKKSKIKGIVSLLKLLNNHKGETIVVGGYAMLAEIIAILYLNIFRVNFVLNSDGGFITDGFLKTLLKKSIIKSASYLLSSGINTSKTLEYYGANPANIYEYHFTSVFENEILKSTLKDNELVILKNKLNLKNDVVYLIFVGRLVYDKGVQVLLDAVKLIKNRNIEILIIGSGDQLIQLNNYAINLGIQDKVHFLGQCSKQEIFDYLKVSDIFVFPTFTDVWGLVINEAISCGLPIISTNAAGAAFSLIHPNQNGFVIEKGNSKQLSEAILKILNMDKSLVKHKSLEIAKKYTIENMVKDHLVLFDLIDKNKKK